MTMGKTIFEWSPGSYAAREIENLTDEIISYVQEDVYSGPEAQAAHG
jgi:chromosome partitioning protein